MECQSPKKEGVWVSVPPFVGKPSTDKKQLHWTAAWAQNAWAQNKLLLC